MTPRAIDIARSVLCVLACAAVARPDGIAVYTCPQGDAVIRRTDIGNDGPMLPTQGLPDVIELSLAAWQPADAAADPYTGTPVTPSAAHLFRLQLKFAGLVNPPGPLALEGDDPFKPFCFGTNPVYGFVELDIDADQNTGGEQPAAAFFRPLANASRFGGRFLTQNSRQAVWGNDLDDDWYESPQYMLSGADFSLVLCGCFPVTVISQTNPASATFDVGQTWVVQGRFFQRAGGYIPASSMTGGSVTGAYDPPVNLQFQHDPVANVTSVTLVYPLDQIGAGLLAGHPPQPINNSCADDTSIAEGVTDLITNCTRPGLYGETASLITHWAGKSVAAVMDPTAWRPRFIVGTSYSQEDPNGALYVYTDVGPAFLRRDVVGNGLINGVDRAQVQAIIAQLDGGPWDADGVVDGQVTLQQFGLNFSLYDIDYDGIIGPKDLALLPCLGDFNGDGVVSVQDIFDFLAAWFSRSPNADYTRDGRVTVQDIFTFLAGWFAPCH